MSHDLTGLAMAPRRSSGNTATLVLLLALAMVAFLGRGYIANLASKDVAGLLGRPVSGIVIDVETGLPVAGARVLSLNSDSRTLVLTHEWSDETRTNAGGEFTVRAGSEDDYGASRIDVSAPGYQEAHATARFDEQMMIQLSRRAGD